MLLRVALAGLLFASLACSSSHSGNGAVDAGIVDAPIPDAPVVTAPMVMTASGPGLGGAADDPNGAGVYRSFYGIPYAKPPVGDLRWAPPVAPDPWTVPPVPQPEAEFEPPACPQVLPLGSTPIPAGNEDCLYLNIDTPVHADGSSRIPVVFWIHGGGFAVGQGREVDDNTRGDLVAQRQDLVVVSFNYRLGQLGFLAHPGLTAEQGGASGNYGLLDQLAALRWVKANIAAFGGDPDNITVMGQSAGGISVCGLLTTPLITDGEDLFQRAIMESAPCDRPALSLSDEEAQGESFAAALGCTDSDPALALACMRGKSVDDVRAALPPPGDLLRPQAGEAFWGPNLDGHYFPTTVDATGHPLALIAAGTYRKVPILMGYMKNEGTAIMNLSMELPAPNQLRIPDDATYRAQVAALVVDAPVDLGVPRPHRRSDDRPVPRVVARLCLGAERGAGHRHGLLAGARLRRCHGRSRPRVPGPPDPRRPRRSDEWHRAAALQLLLFLWRL